jgi:elongation factor Ts
VLAAVLDDGVNAVESLEEERVELVARLGENIAVVGAARYEGAEHEILTAYVHPPANKLGVLLHAKGEPDLAYKVAMHIAAAAPVYVTREAVPEAEVTAEREILSNQEDILDKPEQVREKIVTGRLDKWFEGHVLAEQAWIHDTDRRVGDVLTDAGLEIVEFARFAVAE